MISSAKVRPAPRQVDSKTSVHDAFFASLPRTSEPSSQSNPSELANSGDVTKPQSPRRKRPLTIEALGPDAESCHGHSADFKPRRAAYSSKQVAKSEPDVIDYLLRAAAILCFLVAAYYGWQWLNQDAPAHGDASTGRAHATPIEDVRVGDRLAGRNPIREQAETVESDPATWRKISLYMTKDSGLGLWIDLLRPLTWIEEHDAQPGNTIFIDLYEMGAVGDAKVTYLGPCPPIKPGKGNVVTGMFKHQADENTKVVHLKLEDQIELTGVTDNHPYWSEDRQDFVAVGELRTGELVDTAYGLKRVISVTPIEHHGFLYNLETTEHVFRVGSLGTLVHNSCPDFNPRMREALDWLKARGFDSTKARPFPSRMSVKHMGGRTNGMRHGDIGYRIEFDARSQAHINVFAGKEVGPHFTFSQSEADMLAVLRQLFPN